MPEVYAFPFRARAINGKRVFRPVFTVRLQGPSGMVRGPMLVDSGADCSLIDSRQATRLGLKLDATRRGRVVGRRLGVSRSELLLEVYHPSGWLPPLRIPVEIPSEPMRLPFAVLGREGFFEAFDVAFLLGPNPERGMFCLSPVERRLRRRPIARWDNARKHARIAA